MSGMQVTYNLSRPSGERVTSAQILCTECFDPSFKNIYSTKKYKILTQSFLSDGGDGYSMLKGKSVKTFEYVLVNTVNSYITKKSPIYPAVEWRITIVQNEEDAPDGAQTLRLSLVLLLTSIVFIFK